MPERKPIFYDQEKQRWRRTRLALEIVGGLFTLVLIVFLLNVVRRPELPALLRPTTSPGLRTVRLRQKPRQVRPNRKPKVASLGKEPENYDPLRAAFYVEDDPTSLASLQAHYHDLDLLIPEALHAVSADGRLDADQDPKLQTFLQSLQTRNVDLQVMGMINNYDAKKDKWCPPEMLQMLGDPAARQHLAKQIEDYANAEHEPGIVIDFESMPESSMDNFQGFVHDLGTALHAHGLKLMVALPAADWSYDYKYFAEQSDAIIMMNYDFHWPTSEAGPIAPEDWFEKNIDNMLNVVPLTKSSWASRIMATTGRRNRSASRIRWRRQFHFSREW